MGKTSKCGWASRTTKGQVKNLIGLPILVNWRLNCPMGFRARIPANRRIRQTESQTGLLYRTVMPWLEGSPFGLSLTLASLLCWSRGQPIALYIVPFSVIGISSMLWKEPWSTELGSRSCQSIHLSLGHLWNGDQNSFSICGPLQWCEVRWDNECQKHFVSCKVQSKWERLAFLLYKWDLSFLGSSCCCLVTKSRPCVKGHSFEKAIQLQEVQGTSCLGPCWGRAKC